MNNQHPDSQCKQSHYVVIQLYGSILEDVSLWDTLKEAYQMADTLCDEPEWDSADQHELESSERDYLDMAEAYNEVYINHYTGPKEYERVRSMYSGK